MRKTSKKTEWSRKAVVKRDTRDKLNPNRWAKKYYSICFSLQNGMLIEKKTANLRWKFIERKRVERVKKIRQPTLFSIFKLITITWLRAYAIAKNGVNFFLYTIFYAVPGYHLWCDDVDFASNINIHTLCKQDFFFNEKEMNENSKRKHFMQINSVQVRHKVIWKKPSKMWSS